MRFVGIVSCLCSTAVLALPLPTGVAPAEAGTQDNAKIVFHLQDWSKTPCAAGYEQARDTNCESFSESPGPLQTATAAYLVVTGEASAGLRAVRCGIDYDNAPGSGVDIRNWTACGALEFSLPGPNGDWPAAGSGNSIIWSECQDTVPPGGLFAQGVAGVFYVYAYSDDVLQITPDRTRICYGQLAVTDCNAAETDLMPPTQALGAAGFGSESGLNPCITFVDQSACGVSMGTLDFGEVLVGETRDLTVRVQDAGIGLGLPTFDVPAFDEGAFSLIAGEGHYEGPVQGSVDMTFQFAPTSMGIQEAIYEVEPCSLCPPIMLVGEGVVPTAAERTTWGSLKSRYE